MDMFGQFIDQHSHRHAIVIACMLVQEAEHICLLICCTTFRAVFKLLCVCSKKD